MEYFVDKQKAEKKWNPLMDALKVNEGKREWMPEYAELHLMNESVSYSTLATVSGMGGVVSPQPSTVPGQVWGGGSNGSGDLGQNLLPVSMKIAAQTFALDLIAVKPVSSIKVDLVLLDFRYDDPDLDETDRPLVFKVNAENIDVIKAALKAQLVSFNINEEVSGIDKRTFVSLNAGTSLAQIKGFNPNTADLSGWMEFLGFSKVDGYPMFRIFRQAVEKGTYNSLPAANKNTFAFDSVPMVDKLAAASLFTANSGSTVAETSFVAPKIELISLMEDQLPGFVSNWSLNTPMDRATAEKTYAGQIGTKTFSKSVTVGDIEIKSAVKRQEIEDIKASTGIDVTQKLEGVMVNELSQKISRDITHAIKTLCEKNRVSHTTPKTANGYGFDFNVDAYLTSGFAPGGEQAQSLQRKLFTKIREAANFILQDGRTGRADYVITNGRIGSILHDVVKYAVNPVDKANITAGQLNNIGTFDGMTIYIDPFQRWDDNRIFLGRKNTPDQAGLVFLPFLMAQQVKIISEATLAPVMSIRSRYAIADIGFFPEKQFMSIHVTDTNDILF